MALHVKLKNENDGSERHNCEEMALNAKQWTTTLNVELTNGSKC